MDVAVVVGEEDFRGQVPQSTVEIHVQFDGIFERGQGCVAKYIAGFYEVFPRIVFVRFFEGIIFLYSMVSFVFNQLSEE